MEIRTVPMSAINRPLYMVRSLDQDKLAELTQSIAEEGLREPIDLLEVDGKLYGFNGCHRFEAHLNLGKESIQARVRKADQRTLKAHLI
ncbi:MAG: chromosome partitioning protein ParB [Synechococcus sp. TMED169]|jgi:sulfiredoxin|nr:MAG: chromosome partitioning protein ParB [Synechococcus sp. TMED169]|tara:strand:+ start:235 stop:501 length:267 start_codon:yes stop_codon:yes gene_type:complete